LKSRPSLLIYCPLTQDDITGWTDYVNVPVEDNLEILAIVHDSEEKVPTDWVSFPQPYTFEPTSASVNYHDNTDSETTGSHDGFQGLQQFP